MKQFRRAAMIDKVAGDDGVEARRSVLSMHVAVAIVGFRNEGHIVLCLGALEASPTAISRSSSVKTAGRRHRQPRRKAVAGGQNLVALAQIDRQPRAAARLAARARTWRFAKRGGWAQLGYGLAGWWAGLRGERGVPKWMRG
jgi:hypothetical protein